MFGTVTVILKISVLQYSAIAMVSDIESAFFIQGKPRRTRKVLYGMNDFVLHTEHNDSILMSAVLTHKRVPFFIDGNSSRTHHFTLSILLHVLALSREYLHTVSTIADNMEAAPWIKCQSPWVVNQA